MITFSRSKVNKRQKTSQIDNTIDTQLKTEGKSLQMKYNQLTQSIRHQQCFTAIQPHRKLFNNRRRSSYKQRPKTANNSLYFKQSQINFLQVPGPTTYNAAINNLSKFKKSHSIIFSPKSMTRFSEKLQISPGPGFYLKSSSINQNSQFKSSISFSIKKTRINDEIPSTPGPGYYFKQKPQVRKIFIQFKKLNQ